MIELFTTENLLALLTLTTLEIVLGIDNIVFIAILVGRVEKSKQVLARRLGLMLAMVMRILLLLTINWIIQLTAPLFAVFGHAVTGRDIILLSGGLFLIAKATYEIHHKLEDATAEKGVSTGRASFQSVLLQIIALDLVFSLDSVITAVGMAQHLWVMVTAVILSVLVMLAFAGSITSTIEKHPTLKMLALSFLLLIGVVLVADGSGHHIEKGYIYFAMAFSLTVEILNIRMRTPAKGVGTH